MSLTVKLDTKEVDQWIKNQTNRERAKLQTMTVLKNWMVGEVGKAMDGHSTKNRLKQSLLGTANKESAVVYSSNYGDIVLEYGRKPGKMPPVDPLKEWARIKLGDPNLGYIVARKIARQGTEKHRRGGPKELTMIYEDLVDNFIPKQLVKLLNEYTK